MAEELANQVLAHLDMSLDQRCPIFLRVCTWLEMSAPIENGSAIFLLCYPNPPDDGMIIKYDVNNIEGVAQVMHSMMQWWLEKTSEEAQILLCDNQSGADFGNLKMWTVMM
jgi:hypothetical protein